MIAAFALIGELIILFATQRYGIALQSDSVGYIQVAREILQGRSIPSSFTLQPPLYPALLAFSALITFSDPLTISIWVNAFLFAGVIFLSGILLLRHLENFPALALLGTIGVLFSRALLGMALTAFSELLFILLSLVLFFSLEKFVGTNRRGWLALAIVATACACLTRYIGATLIATGALALLWMLRANRTRAFVSAGVFAVLSALPLVAWAIRNIIASGDPFGPRAASRYTLLENVALTMGTVANWFVPDSWAWIFYMLGILLVGVWLWTRFVQKAHYAQAPSLAPYIFYVIIFVAFLVITSTITAYNRIGTRLLSPIYVPLLLVMLVLFNQVWESLRVGFSKRLLNGAALGLVGLLFLFPVQTDWTTISRARAQGAGGYNTTQWRASETIHYVRTHRGELTDPIITNGPDVLYILADVNAISVLPKFQYASNERAYEADTLRGVYPPKPSTLVWLTNSERDDFLFTLPELQELTHLTLVTQLQDGAVYRMERK
ncbi:MAG TPA: hypothetical protein VFD70_14880 [Anaerolineae bacterium]|nr:hypothetical protein [Anaerolineae bacterium]